MFRLQDFITSRLENHVDLKSLTARLKRPVSAPGSPGLAEGAELLSADDDSGELSPVPCETAKADLIASLKEAIKIEFFTIPPYLTAWWSISDSSHIAAETVRGIAIEEMIHFGLAANLLVAISDETVDFKDFVPTYPSEAPANARPGLIVNLRRFDQAQAETFADLEAFDEGGDVDTIGEFYAALQTRFDDLFDRCGLSLQVDRQVSYGSALSPLTSRDDVARAIDLIRRQGEGHPSDGNPFEDPDHPELGFAHFFQFKEYALGRKYVLNDHGQWEFDPDLPVDPPAVIPIADHPAGGSDPDTLPDDVRTKLEQFDADFTAMLETMTSAWNQGDSDMFGGSVIQMYGLSSGASDIMATPIEGSTEFYAPRFRVTST